jgi:hypothetical protein
MITATRAPTSSSVVVATPDLHCARAYCGPAHGLRWDLSGDPPRLVSLRVGDDVWSYRLVHNPDTGLPARDHMDNYLYVPGRYTGDH